MSHPTSRISYAGIGSRRTPALILRLITELASSLADRGYLLRSGHARGADQAFETGADTRAEVYLPWPRFEASAACTAGYVQLHPTPEATQMAAQHHPAWDRLGRGARSLHARNCHQILGRDLDDPASFVVCWTPDGATTNPRALHRRHRPGAPDCRSPPHPRLQPRAPRGPRTDPGVPRRRRLTGHVDRAWPHHPCRAMRPGPLNPERGDHRRHRVH